MAQLPTGTVTFLFTDIEDSTPLVHQLGERYAQVQRDHQALLRAVWAAHAGVEVDTQGDSFFVAFSRATDALAAAIEAQQALAAHAWPAGARVRVRMGMHTGSAVLASPRQYIGIDVIRAARIAAAGHGGQVLLSQATRDQVAKELVAGAGLRDLGRHRLKGLARREEIYQLVLPGMPANYPPLKTLDAWPGYRADLVAVVLLSAVLLAAIGLALPLVASSFPRWIGLGAAGLAALLLVSSVVARPVRRGLAGQWHAARKPFATVTSSLLSLVVVLTTLFVTKPPIFIGLPHLGYDFSYTPHTSTRMGGMVTVGLEIPIEALTPFAPFATQEGYYGLWQSCLIGLPDGSFKPDQCTQVPSVENGGEDPQGKWTILHIDQRAVWSDGAPITADDYLFVWRLISDPNIGGGSFPGTLTKLDARTVRVDWSGSVGDFLTLLLALSPLPLHIYATGKFADVYDPATGAYNSALAQQLVTSASYFTQIPVDDGPFTVQSFVSGHRAVLVRNSRFFSNFFHHPAALDGVTFVTVNPQWPHGLSHSQVVDDFVADYRRGVLDLVEGLGPYDLSRLGGVPKAQVITSPLPSWIELGFNQRGVAPNAQANQGVSIFRDTNVRKAFVEAFDRCAAVRAQLGAVNCSDPNLFTDELTVKPAPDYDPSVKLPAYNPADAARLLTQAGYPVVDGIRRYKDGRTPLQLIIDIAPGGAEVPLIGPRMQRDYMRNLQIPITLVSAPDFFHGGPVGQATTGAFDIALFEDDGAPDPTVNVNLTTLALTDAKDIPSAQKPFPLGWNYFGILDSWVVQQEQLGSETVNDAQRAGVYRELQRRWAQQFYVEPVFILANVTLTKPTLCNFKKFPLAGYNTWNMADWYDAPSCPS